MPRKSRPPMLRVVWPSILAALTFVTPAMASPKTFTAKGIACHDAAAIGELTRLAAENKRKVFASFERLHQLGELWSVGASAGNLLTVNRGRTGSLQSLDLCGQVLAVGADSNSLCYPHPAECSSEHLAVLLTA
jgi:hypothetical protein